MLICYCSISFFVVVKMWPDLIQKAKDGGLNTIETYVFWNGHEPRPREVRNISSTLL
jgi:hypothetical protein